MRLISERNVRVPMRDGVALATDILRPDVPGPVPTVLSRTPYDKTLVRIGDLTDHVELAERGYAVIAQDVRGRIQSAGTFTPFVNESRDGFDTMAWIAAQPWSDGQVATHGASYLGATQWLAAMARPPALRAMIPNVTSAEYHENWAYQGGAFQLGFAVYWAHSDFTVGHGGAPDTPADLAARREAMDDLLAKYRHRPHVGHDLLGRRVPWFAEWLAHAERDDYWRSTAPNEHYDQITVPALNIGGWYDVFANGTVDNYVGMRARGGSAVAREGQRLIMGPWSHRTIQSTGDFADRRYGVRATTAGSDLVGEHTRWFDRWLRGVEPATAPPRVRVFVMGSNRWRDADDWPLPEAVARPLYLHSGGSANTRHGTGALAWEAPGVAEPPDTYVADPLDPVPSMGGPTLTQVGAVYGWNAGPYDQRVVEDRPDVLVYTSAVLTAPLEVVGPIELVLYASSSARDTDFTAKLVDVWPDGRAENLTDGILRARYRESLAAPRPLEPGRIEQFRIYVGPTANTFLPGHRLRLEVASSNFPRFDPNPQTGRPTALDTLEDLRLATNRVFHDRAHPSHLVMPVVQAQ